MARSCSDLRHTINRCRSQASRQRMLPQEEEGFSTDPTYCSETCPEGVEARIKDLERRIGGMARNMARGSACDHTNTETESPFSTWVTRFSVPRKFKQPHIDSYNGSGSPVDHVWTYKA